MAAKPRRPSEIVIYKGITFRRYPTSEKWPERVYFTPSGNHRKAGVLRLHQEIWRDLHGPIPAGHHVHHQDHNPLNNDPANLLCIPGRDHGKHHAAAGHFGARLDSYRPQALAAAAEWHRSPQGREWHREHGKATWVDRPMRTEVCEQCGASYETRKPSNYRFCSNACKSAWRRASGVDDVTRPCELCGTEFTSNRYSRSKTCSKSCARKLGRSTPGVRRPTITHAVPESSLA